MEYVVSMKLLVRAAPEDKRMGLLRAHLTTDWEIESVRPDGDPALLAAQMEGADAMISMRWPADWPRPERLRLIQLPGAGYDAIAFSALPPNASVCNVYEHEIGIAEFVFAAMLEREIGLRRMDDMARVGDWSLSIMAGGPMHGELFGKTLGIVGFGRIGIETARRARAFGMKVIAATRSPDRHREEADRIDGMDSLDDLLGEADYVLVCCPLTARTKGLIDRAALGRMKGDAVIVNVGRGPLIDEDALYEACRDKRIGGAIIDVWYNYPAGGRVTGVPPSRHPFQDLDNVLMSPHTSGATTGLFPRRYRRIADNLDRLARGEPLINLLYTPGGTPPE